VLQKKDIYTKDDIKKITFNQEVTENRLTKKSFVENFLSSIKQKMYKGKK
jgi:hypothetical protein